MGHRGYRSDRTFINEKGRSVRGTDLSDKITPGTAAFAGAERFTVNGTAKR